jgi:GT2 family glycosyltransferase
MQIAESLHRTISICICTRDRPDDLRRCLASVRGGDELPNQVIVSDDSEDRESIRAICAEFRFVAYVRGPGRGLSANRNTAIRAASGDYIAFLDDDATVSADFVSTSRKIVANAAPNAVFTGRMNWNGVLYEAPGSRTFLGHFGRNPGRRVENIHMPCSNLFPRSAFEEVLFDEVIRYGYDEMDIANELRAAGFRIEFRPELLNFHTSAEKTEEEEHQRDFQATRARFYTTLKYHLRHGSTAMVPVYALIASVHEAAHRAKAPNGSPPLDAFRDMSWALTKARRAARH